MYCSRHGCYNEMVADPENVFDLCAIHWQEFKEKKTTIDYSKHQTLSKDLPKDDLPQV